MVDTVSLSNILQQGLSNMFFEELGFESASDSRLPDLLDSISPSGSTAMRDAILESSLRLLKIGGIINKIGTGKLYNFVNIILTDGDDNASKASIESTCQAMMAIGASLPCKTLKTFFIGVDLQSSSKAAAEIAAMVVLGGKNAQYMNVKETKIEDVFEKIKISIGIKEQTQAIATKNINGDFILALSKKKNPYILAEKQKFVVLFTLDVSGSMEGERWEQVCSSVRRFVEYLDKDDLVCGVVFNNKVKVLTESD